MATQLYNRKSMGTMKQVFLFSRFIFVGIINTVVGYTLFAILTHLEIFYLVSLTVSHILATVNSYFWNRKFTFKSNNKINGEIQRFVLVYTSTYICNFILLFIAVDFLKVKPVIAQVPIIFIVAIVSFLGQRLFTFKPNQTLK